MRYFYMMLNHSGNHIKIEHEFFKPDRNPTERLHLQTHDPLLVPQDPTEGIGPVFTMPFHFNKSLWGNRGRTILSLKYSLHALLPRCSISTPVIFLREKEQFFFLLSKEVHVFPQSLLCLIKHILFILAEHALRTAATSATTAPVLKPNT